MMKEESMRVIAPTLVALILLGNVACAGHSQPDSANGNSPQSNPEQWYPITSVPGALRRDLVGDNRQPGPFKYQLKIPARSRIAVHRHSKDVHVKVVSGSMFIIIGEPLEASRVQRFTAGNVFVVPANAWHDEWWDEETVLEAEGVGPMETVYKGQ
jgi:mannose-6-phosphate isomerase-like protein (cupin superfamily)